MLRARQSIAKAGRLHGERAQAEEELIWKIREFYGIAEPRLHKAPRWMRLKKHRAFVEELRQQHLLDHYGSLDGWLVSEPYLKHETVVAVAGEIAARHGMEFQYTLMSWWYPMKTIRIMWRPRDSG